jgi:hypothetical protein
LACFVGGVAFDRQAGVRRDAREKEVDAGEDVRRLAGDDDSHYARAAPYRRAHGGTHASGGVEDRLGARDSGSLALGDGGLHTVLRRGLGDIAGVCVGERLDNECRREQYQRESQQARDKRIAALTGKSFASFS